MIVTEKIKSSKRKDKILFCLISDAHIDNKHSDVKLLKKHLDEAVQKDAKILINGDSLDVMQGKKDPRSSKSDLREELKGSNYLDRVVDYAVEFFKPYAKHISLIAKGNHETSINNHLETDLLRRVVDRLNSETGSRITLGGYKNWHITHIQMGNFAYKYRIFMHHGYGGAAPVTKGKIQHSRVAEYIEGADVIWMGHTHTDYEHVRTIEALNNSNRIVSKNILEIRTSTYKEEYFGVDTGWHIERGAGPKSLGGRWVEVNIKRDDKDGLIIDHKSYRM